MELSIKQTCPILMKHFCFRGMLNAFVIEFESIVKLNEEHINTLFLKAKQGEKNAYAEFLRSITPKLTGMVRAMVFYIDSADIEDIVQDILITIHTKRHTWDERRPALPWVYTVARHRIIDYGRKTKTNVQMIAMNNVPEAELSIEDAPDISNLEDQVKQLGGKLASVTKAIGIEGKTIQETSKLLNMSENAVRIAFHRALKKIRSE